MTRDNIVGTLHGDDHIQGTLSVGGGVSSYTELEDLPTLNGETIIGNMSIWQPKNFSETEQNTGIKWIDGKNIYCRVFSTTTAGESGFSIGTIDNLDTVIYQFGEFKRLNNWYTMDGRTESPSYNNYYCKCDVTTSGNVNIGYGGYSASELKLIFVIVFYTKTV